MKLIFIAGPYRANTHHQLHQNIEAARQAAEVCWRQGWAVICPHLNSQFISGIMDEERFLEGYKAILARCDAILLMADWMRSEGARAEYDVARHCGLDIYQLVGRDKLLLIERGKKGEPGS